MPLHCSVALAVHWLSSKVFVSIACSFDSRQIISADLSHVNYCSDSSLANVPLLFYLDLIGGRRPRAYLSFLGFESARKKSQNRARMQTPLVPWSSRCASSVRIARHVAGWVTSVFVLVLEFEIELMDLKVSSSWRVITSGGI